MTTAFQVNAFQNNAFQIDFTIDTHDGADNPRKFYLPVYVSSGKKKQSLGNLIKVYDRVREKLPTEKRLLSLVDSYIEPVDEIEQSRRNSTQFIADELLPIDRINIAALIENQMALDILVAELSRLEIHLKNVELIKQQELSDDLLLFTLAACI